MTINVSEAIDQDTGELVLVERTSGSGFENGIWVKGDAATFMAAMSVQAASAEELEDLPEGARDKDPRKFISKVLLRTVSDSAGTDADVVVYRGSRFKIIAVKDWIVYGHNKAFGVKEQAEVFPPPPLVLSTRLIVGGSGALFQHFTIEDDAAWPIDTNLLADTPPTGFVRSLNHTGRFFFYAQIVGGNSFRLFDATASMPYPRINFASTDTSLIKSSSFTADNNRMFLGNDGSGAGAIASFDVTDINNITQFPRPVAPLPGTLQHVHMQPSGRYLAVTHQFGDGIAVYDTTIVPYPSVVVDVTPSIGIGRKGAFHPALSIFALATSSAPYAFFWDTSSWEQLASLPAGGLASAGQVASFNPAGDILAVTNSQGLFVYEALGPDPAAWTLSHLLAVGSTISDLAWSVDGRYLATEDGDVFDFSVEPPALTLGLDPPPDGSDVAAVVFDVLENS